MFKWFKKASQEPVQYKIVELTKRGPQSNEEGIKESVATLASHPGFVWLIKRLELQRSALKSKLDLEKHETLREVDFLQAGIYWAGWLQQETARMTTKLPQRKLDPFEEELVAFRELDSAIERVGEE